MKQPREPAHQAQFDPTFAAIRFGIDHSPHHAAPLGLHERLVQFRVDHFTTVSRSEENIHLITPYIESAVRPHVTGDFADMLFAVTPYLTILFHFDQSGSVGAISTVGLRRGQGLVGVNRDVIKCAIFPGLDMGRDPGMVL